MNEGIREQVMDVLNDALARIAEDEAAAARKRKSPNKSGVVQLDPETYAIVAEYATQKEALAALGKEDNGIPLIRIPYTHYDKLCIEDLLLESSAFLFN